MTDLEMTKLCAEAMGYSFAVFEGQVMWHGKNPYDPLSDDAQAMALLKKFHLRVSWGYAEARGAPDGTLPVMVNPGGAEPPFGVHEYDLNRAIVECVARMQEKR